MTGGEQRAASAEYRVQKGHTGVQGVHTGTHGYTRLFRCSGERLDVILPSCSTMGSLLKTLILELSNIMGNRYRLVVRIVFEYRVIQVKWFGTHSEYDSIDVVSIQPRRS